MENLNQIWVDKYRPQKFSEIIGQKNYIKRIKSFIETKNLPHLLFAGVPGTGKTTTAHVIAKKLYNKNALKGNFLELNASDDRGIDVIRHQIKEFAKLKSLTNIPYKIICLDEADSLTKDAQQALRRTMEKYSATCRFILCCNQISKILDPIQSRCVIFKFKGLTKENLIELLEKIEKQENLKITNNAKELLIKISLGDTRKIINSLQAASSINKEVTTKLIEEILEYVNPKEITQIINYALKSEFIKAKDLMLKLKIIKGLSGTQILKEMYNQIIELKIDPKLKIKIIDKIATIEFRIVEGCDEELQIQALLAMMGLIKN